MVVSPASETRSFCKNYNFTNAYNNYNLTVLLKAVTTKAKASVTCIIWTLGGSGTNNRRDNN